MIFKNNRDSSWICVGWVEQLFCEAHNCGVAENLLQALNTVLESVSILSNTQNHFAQYADQFKDKIWVFNMYFEPAVKKAYI